MSSLKTCRLRHRECLPSRIWARIGFSSRPRRGPGAVLERTFEIRFPGGRPYQDRTSAGNRITARLSVDVVDAQIFGVSGLPTRPVSAGAALPVTVRLKNAGTVRFDARFREEGSGREVSSETVRLEPGEVKPVPWTLLVPERAPARFTPALVLSWVEIPLPSRPLGGATRIALNPDGPLLSRVGVPERALTPGQWYTLDVSVVSSDDRNAANNRGRWVLLLGGDGRVSEMRRLP